MVEIEGKGIGSRKRLFDSFSVPLADLQSSDSTTNLKYLITKIVTDQVNMFSERQDKNQFLIFLTEEKITKGIRAGKITSGLSDVPDQPVDTCEAIATATEAFNDGLFIVFIDSIQINTLDEHISLKEDSRIMFIRLSLIAGG